MVMATMTAKTAMATITSASVNPCGRAARPVVNDRRTLKLLTETILLVGLALFRQGSRQATQNRTPSTVTLRLRRSSFQKIVMLKRIASPVFQTAGFTLPPMGVRVTSAYPPESFELICVAYVVFAYELAVQVSAT